MGVHWERTLTKTTNVHKCSDIHPSFKLTDVITRECLRNRTWAPVNISQCVMSSDSPVVMIVTVSLDTTNISLVKSNEDMIALEVSSFPANHLYVLHTELRIILYVCRIIHTYVYVTTCKLYASACTYILYVLKF